MKHVAWHIVGILRALADFIVTVIVFSKPRTAGAHCLVFLQKPAWTVSGPDAGSQLVRWC